MKEMDYELDVEVIRLKKLLEDNLLQAEKENLELIRRGCSNLNFLTEATSVSRTQHKTLPSATIAVERITKLQDGKASSHSTGDKNSCSLHANIHHLNHMEHLLLNNNMKRRVLQNEAKSKYIPCAIPLSPPIRIKKEENLTFSSKQVTFTEPPFIHEISHREMNTSGKHLVVEALPGITIKDVKEKPNSVFDKSKTNKNSNSRHKSHISSFTSSKTESDSSEEFTSFTNKQKNYYERSSYLSTGETVPKSVVLENPHQATEESPAFKLQISLDSSSATDVVNNFLQKLPESFNQTRVSLNRNDTCQYGSKEKCQEDKSQRSKTRSPSNDASEGEKTLNQSFKTASTQTVTIMDEVCIQPMLHSLVRHIVQDTLKNMENSYHCPCRKPVSLPLKVDSGIQSEVENASDINESYHFPGSGSLFNNRNCKNQGISKAVQVAFNLSPIECPENQVLNHENLNINQEFDRHFEKKFVQQLEIQQLKDTIAEAGEKQQKVDSMLEKIYEHVYKENIVRNEGMHFPDSCPISTRDVAVQFNPLQTSTKSTTTTEIKITDSSCQYDVPPTLNLVQKSFANISVQTEEEYTVVNNNVSTQYEAKTFQDNFVQTEVLHSEHSISNASLSSTPVSDSMFMDDMLSEGEISLPWNLRLLSHPGGGMNMNNTDGSGVSLKDKDYSLSEGEIPPNLLCYRHMIHCDGAEENGMNQETFPKYFVDTKMQHLSRNDQEKFLGYRLAQNQNQTYYHYSSSSLSEGEMNQQSSLSLGEIPQSFKMPLAESSRISDLHPSTDHFQSPLNFCCDQSSASSSIHLKRSFTSNPSEGVAPRQHGNDEMNLHQEVLIQIDEEETLGIIN